jgi:2-polyprenyl-3-methyl-5-hydroxy-6-metoxy-1,4-benzoquinol methylase
MENETPSPVLPLEVISGNQEVQSNMPVGDDQDSLLDEQISYYKARAGEYDEWFYRQGRYDHGSELNERWFAEVEEVQLALDNFEPKGQVLEIACGTGIWTERLARYAMQITALDAAPEVLAINRARLASSRVRYLQTDIFAWEPDRKYDIVFFSFWLSHVPTARFSEFWDLVSLALKPGGRVFFIDSRFDATSTAKDHRLKSPESTTVQRRLNDGREYRIVKVFYRQKSLTDRLSQLGWRFEIRQTSAYFIYGQGQRDSAGGRSRL